MEAKSLQERLRELAEQTAGSAPEEGAGEETGPSDATQVTIRDHGQIRTMVLPGGWVEERREEGSIGSRSFWSFHPPASPGVRICFYYRGRLVSPEAGQKFSAVLKVPPHWLTSTQIASLAEIIREKKDPDDFQALLFQINNFNGKKVLLVEGRYKTIDEDTIALYIDADGTGRAIQEIFFQAPKGDYPRYLKEAKAALGSIVWK